MKERDDIGNAEGGPRLRTRSLVELAIVGGASLFFIFYLIPAQTAHSDNFGLSPRMLPITCATLIAGLAGLNFVLSLWDRSEAEPGPARKTYLPLVLLVGVAVVGAFVMWWHGLVAGGAVLTFLSALVIGERRPLRLLAMAASAAALMVLVDWSGL